MEHHTPPTGEALRALYKTAARYGPLRIAGGFALWRRGLHLCCVPTAEIRWAYRRRLEATASMCCGRADFSELYLVAHTGSGKELRWAMPSRAVCDAALEALEAENPHMAVGYYVFRRELKAAGSGQ